MSFPIKLTVNNNSASINQEAAKEVITYTCTVTRTSQPAGTLPTQIVTTEVGRPFNVSNTLPAGRYHLHIDGSDGSKFDADFTIPTSPPVTRPIARAE
ncbi:MAG: hypothetical protein K2X87_33855 [Gemmataceae bacterium]|nr:hypothetical protein [Gemmataceae bacterium]